MPANILDGGSSVLVGNAVQWQGPYNPGEVGHQSDEGFDQVMYSQPLATTTAIATGLLASDPPWWTAVVGQIVDGGNVSSSYSNTYDGGTA